MKVILQREEKGTASISKRKRQKHASPSARSFGPLAQPHRPSRAQSRVMTSRPDPTPVGQVHHIVGDGAFRADVPPHPDVPSQCRRMPPQCRLQCRQLRNVLVQQGRGQPTWADLYWARHAQDSMHRGAQRDSSPSRRRQSIGPRWSCPMLQGKPEACRGKPETGC